MKRILSLFIASIMMLFLLAGCSFLPDKLKLCEVNFYVNDELYETKTGMIGSTIGEPSAPQIENQIFMGWYTKGLFSSEFDFSSKLTGNMDLYAYFVIDAIAVNDMIVKETINSTVKIENRSYTTVSGTDVEWNYNIAQGSGVVIDISAGYCYVLTNCHVVELQDGFDKQKVSVEDPWGNVYEAKIYKNPGKKDYAMSSAYDLALLCFKYSPSAGSELKEIETATNPSVGEYVVAIGTPNGLQNAVTYGQVLDYQEIKEGENENLKDMNFSVIVHNAYLDHGSSGGALVDTSGKLVGINFAGYNNGEYGCSIPVEKILEFMKLYVY